MKKILRKIFISHEEAQIICDKSQYNEATLWEKFQLNIRFIHSKVSRNYTTKNNKLTQLCNKAGLKTLSLEEKNAMKKALESRLSK